MTTYIPTKEELEELGFIKVHGTSFYGWKPKGSVWNKLYINSEGVDINGVKLYPHSLSDLKTLIEMFTPNN